MENSDIHIVVVEDEPVTRAKLAGYFEREGYQVSEACDGDDLHAALSDNEADLVLLDINLPGEDGLFLTRWLRGQNADIGIILVTGRTDEVDRIVGLEMGADDYVTKPFNYRELLARSKNLLRRATSARRHKTDGALRFSGWTFDISTRRLTSPDGARTDLTRAEFELLSALVKHPGIVMNRDRLLDNVSHRKWDPNDRTIDVLVRRLRQKIEADPTQPEIILTAHGEGYVFACALE